MLQIMGGISLGSLFPRLGFAQRNTENLSMTDLNESVDVLVVGGGPAGIIAAIQSARAGAKTMLVERGSHMHLQ